MRWRELSTPIGPLGVAADSAGIRRISFSGMPSGAREAARDLMVRDPAAQDALLLDRAADELAGYFAGVRTGFTLPLVAAGGSDFERAVWAAIAAIPYAEMRTYGEIAARIGAPDAARAVGVACNRNPLPIVVPCHRVVGAGGTLVGFGGGLHRKRHLLELEARVRITRDFGALAG